MGFNILISGLIAALSLIAAFYVIYKEKKENKKLKMRMAKMSYSKMFSHLLPLLYKSKDLCISSLHIDSDFVSINYIYSGRNAHDCFDLQSNGFYRLSNINIEVISQLIELEIPTLSNNRKYTLHKTYTQALNGDIKYNYNYYMTPNYRKAVVFYKENDFAINTMNRA